MAKVPEKPTLDSTSLKKKITLQQQEITAFKTDILEQQAMITDLTKDLAKTQNLITQAKNSLNTCKKDIPAVKDEISALDTKLKEQEKQKEEAELKQLEIAAQKKAAKAPKIPIVNLAIIYDSNAELSDSNHSMGTNTALPKSLKSLLIQEESPLLVNGAIAQVLLHFMHNPQEQSFKSNGLTILRSAMQNFKKDDWELYAIYRPEPFILFIQKEYLATHKNHGLNLEKLTKFESKDIPTIIDNLEQAPKPENKTAQTILSLFKLYNEKDPITWNIIIDGHGLTSSKEGFTPTKLALKNSGAVIAGIPSDQFIKLIEGWGNTIKPNIIFWITCFGGGLNAESLQQIITIIKSLKGDFNPGILLSAAPSDETIYLQQSDFDKTFKTLASIENGKSTVSSIITNASQALDDVGGTHLSGLIFIPEIGIFQPLKLSYKITEEGNKQILTIKDTTTKEPLVIKDPLKTRIKFIAPGENTVQTINTIKAFDETTDIEMLFDLSIFSENRKNKFFKIININKIILEGDEKNISQKISFPNEKNKVLYNVKAVIFPEDLTCPGYIAFSITDTFPRDIYLWKGIKKLFIDFIPVHTYTQIKNQAQLDVTMQRIQQQALVNGLFEKNFINLEMKNVDSAINLLEKPATALKTDKDFSTLMATYDIPAHILPNEDGFQNILIYIAQNCRKGLDILKNMVHAEKIINRIENLDKKALSLLEEGCVNFNIINIPLALKQIPNISTALLVKIQKNFETEPAKLYEGLLIKLLNTATLPSDFLNALANHGTTHIRKVLYTKYPETKPIPRNKTQDRLKTIIMLRSEEIAELLAFPHLYTSEAKFLYAMNSNLTSDQLEQLLPVIKESFPNVDLLDLSNNDITIISPSIDQLPNLNWLNLSNNKIKSIPQYLFKLKNLEFLDLSKNPLENKEEVKKHLEESLPNLKTLNI